MALVTVLARQIPAFNTVRIGGELLPTDFAQALATDWQNLYDLRDYILNLFVDDELPAGPINGTNKNFVLSSVPQPQQSLDLYRNGSLLIFNVDYVLTGNVINMAAAPLGPSGSYPGDTLVAYYRKRGGAVASFSSPSGPSTPSGGGGTGSNLWTLTPGGGGGGFLYPTTLTNLVLAGINSTDFPAGTGSIISNKLVGVFSAATNATLMYMSVSGGVEVSLNSNISGTGTLLPLSVIIANQRVMRFQISPIAALVGIPTSDAVVGGAIISSSAFIIASASTNASIFEMGQAQGVSNQLISTVTGTGTQLPMTFVIGSNEAARFDLNRTFLVGFTSTDFGASGRILANVLVGVINATTNASVIYLLINGSTETILDSDKSGTGTFLPLSFFTSNARRVSIDNSGTLLVGLGPTTAIPSAGRVVSTVDLIVISGTTANESFGRILMQPGVDVLIQSATIGTGTLLPLSFAVGGTVAGLFTTNLAFLVGGTTSDAFNSAGEIASIGANSAVGAASATANASFIYLFCGGSPSVVTISSGHSGTGTTQPIAINSFGVEQARWTTGGTYLVGLTSTDFFTGSSIVASAGAGMGLASATANADVLLIRETSNLMQIDSSHSGTGTTRPLQFAMTESEIMRFTTAGVALFGLASTDLSVTLGTVVTNTTNSAGFIVVSATTNASVFQMTVFNSLCSFTSTKTGTGTTLPITFGMVGTEIARFRTAGSHLLGLTSSDITDALGWLIASGRLVVATATVNASSFFMAITAGTEAILAASATGSGTLLPISFYTNNSRVATITTAGSFIVGSLTSDFTNGSFRCIVVAGYYALMGAATNASGWYSVVNGTTELQFVTTHTGSGTTLPISFYWVSGATILLPLQISQNAGTSRVFVNRNTDDGSGAVLQVAGNISVNGTVLNVP